MKEKRPITIADYIRAAPKAGQPHLHQIYQLLKGVAPDAQETIKWGNPFFVEPRFLFAFSAYKAHLSFAPGPDALELFQDDLKQYKTTRNFLQIPYGEPLPAGLIRKIAEHRLKVVSEREGDSFW